MTRFPTVTLGLAALTSAVLVAVVPAGGRAAESSRPARGGSESLLGALSLTSQPGPVTVNSKELEFDYKARTLTYRTDVTVVHGDVTVRAATLRVSLGEGEDFQVKQIVAEGGVRVEQGTRLATGDRAVFDDKTRTVVLTGRAVLREGRNEVTGDRVVVFLDEERGKVEGEKAPVRVTLFPSDAKPGKGNGASSATDGSRR